MINRIVQKISRLIFQLNHFIAFIRYSSKKTALQKNGDNFYENQSFDATEVIFDMKGRNNVILIGKGVKGTLHISVRGSNHEIKIGDEVTFYGTSRIDTRSKQTKIYIGAKTTTQGSVFYCREPNTEILIGEDCLLAEQTAFLCTDFHSIIDAQTCQRTNYAQKVVLANHVWIGLGVRVLKNTSIGQNTIVGAGSVVTRDIPDHVVAIGVPAQPVKSNVNWDKKLIP